MRNEEKMSIDERRKYLKLVVPRYSRSDKAGKGGILTGDGSGDGATPQKPDQADGYAQSGAGSE